MEINNDNIIRSVQRALDILLCFSIYERELTLTEISQKLNLAKSTTSRLLATLESQDFISRDLKTGAYSLGHNLYYLGLIAKENLNLRNIAHPIMLELREETQETINLYLLDKLERVCFEHVESPHTLKQTVRVGERFPLWDGATGRIILSYLDESIWQDKVKQLKPITESTIIDPKLFIESLKESRALGYAVSVGEKYYDIGCVAAPIFESTGKIIGSICISGPRFRFPESTDNYRNLIVDAADRISSQLGYYGRPLNYKKSF